MTKNLKSYFRIFFTSFSGKASDIGAGDWETSSKLFCGFINKKFTNANHSLHIYQFKNCDFLTDSARSMFKYAYSSRSSLAVTAGTLFQALEIILFLGHPG